jgi:hypothetical protein
MVALILVSAGTWFFLSIRQPPATPTNTTTTTATLLPQEKQPHELKQDV